MVNGVSVKLPGGEVVRYGPDEPLDIPSGINWSTEMPGGFGPCDMTVPRPSNLHKDDQLLYSDVRVYGDGNETLYEGYVVGVPQSNREFCNLQLAGHNTLLARIENFREIFVDRSLNRWDTQPSPSRQDTLEDVGLTGVSQGATVDWDYELKETRLRLELGRDETNPHREVYYDAGPGCQVKQIWYSMSSKSAAAEQAVVGVADDNSATNFQLTSDLITGTDSSATGTFTASPPRRHGMVIHDFFGAMGADHYTRWLLAAYGNHPVTLRGSSPQGVYGGDVIAYLISLSPLNGSLGGSIEKTTQVIPHLTFTEDTSLQSAVEQVTALGGSQLTKNDWGVYEDKEFFWQPPGTYGKTWHVRRDQTANDTSEGPDVDQRVAGVKVNFQDASGRALSVGPPGSHSDFETTELVDSDPANPAHRVPGMFLTVDIGTAPLQADGSPRAAINYGIAVLNTRNRLAWRGSIDVTGVVTDEHGNEYPAARVRAGDRIIIDDADVPEEMPIGSTSYSDDTETVAVNVGARPDTLETHLAQLAAATELVFG